MLAPRYSLRTLLLAIALFALALASFLHPWRSWCPALMFTLLLLLLLLSIPVAIYTRGRERAFCVGFAAVGWVYFVLVFGPWSATAAARLLAVPVAEVICSATTGSLGDLPLFLEVTHTLFTFTFAWAGGLIATRCYAQATAGPTAIEAGRHADRDNTPTSRHSVLIRKAQ